MNDRAKYTNTTEEQQNRIDDVRNMFSDVYDFIELQTKQRNIISDYKIRRGSILGNKRNYKRKARRN